MALTYQLVASTVLANNSVSTVTLSALPNSYTDFVLWISTRNNAVGNNGTNHLLLNGDSASVYATQVYSGRSSGATEGARFTAQNSGLIRFTASSGDDANGFGGFEIYIPDYVVGGNKAVSYLGGGADKDDMFITYANIMVSGQNFGVSSVNIRAHNFGAGDTFAAGSSFFLYGILRA